MSPDFLLTSLIVVLVPGTGVIYTLSNGLFRGQTASVAAAFGCTLGICPHLLVTILGLAALLHTSALAYQVIKYLGVAYIFYLAWGIWRDTGSLRVSRPVDATGLAAIVIRGFLINILNPKLSIFFLALLPQFVPAAATHPVLSMSGLAGVFMAMTLVVFIVYGLLAAQVRVRVIGSPEIMRWLRYSFAGALAFLALRLAFLA